MIVPYVWLDSITNENIILQVCYELYKKNNYSDGSPSFTVTDKIINSIQTLLLKYLLQKLLLCTSCKQA